MAPAGSGIVTVRPARLADADAIGRVQSESWRSTYPGLVPDDVLLRMTPQRQATLWRRYLGDSRRPMGTVLVAEGEREGVVAFGSCGAEQTGRLGGYDGEVYTLYVGDFWRGRGIGQRLLHAMFARLAADGHKAVAIWVLDGNPARFFYEAMGGTLIAQRKSREWGTAIAERAYGWYGLDRFA
ncbi:MAG: GNAT family N-acetyltransferase [Alphaproteobacteria bacterium]